MQEIKTLIYRPAKHNFYLLIGGQIISVFGSALLRFALSLYVLDITGRADMFATMFAISNIPLLLAPLGGAIADRFNRRNLMALFDFCGSTITFLYLLLLLGGNTSIFAIGVVMVLLSFISAMDSPLVTASLPQIVEEEKLEGANGIVQAVQSLSNVIGPVVGGILYGYFGVQALVIGSAVAFALASGMEICIDLPYEKRKQEGSVVKTIMKDLKGGFVYVGKQKFILKAMFLAACLNLLITPYILVGAPIILRVTMQSSDLVYGMGMGLINGATIVGALIIGLVAKRMSIRKLYYWTLIIVVLCIPMSISCASFFLDLGYLPSFVLFMLSICPIAMILTILSIYIITKVQKRTSNENLGKVMAIIVAVAQCMAPIGQLIYGFIFEGCSENMYLPAIFVGILLFVLSMIAKKILRNEEEL